MTIKKDKDGFWERRFSREGKTAINFFEGTREDMEKWMAEVEARDAKEQAEFDAQNDEPK